MQICRQNTLQYVSDFLGLAVCFLLLSVVGKVTFGLPSDEPVGLWVYLDYCALLSAGLCLPLLFLPKGRMNLVTSVTWGLILWGGIQAIWGIMQLCGFVLSRHSLYALTGAFFNPGPYSGYLAMVLPLCLHEWMTERSGVRYLAAAVGILIVCVLPAGMSRSAWLAAGISCLAVYVWYHPFRFCRSRRRIILIVAVLLPVFILSMYLLYLLKPASAGGRFFIWKMCMDVIAQQPEGCGAGHFAQTIGEAQEAYFHAGNYSAWEVSVAGSPKYAFNEYLQIAVEQGVVLCILGILLLWIITYRGWLCGHRGICAALLSLGVFACSSYPLQIPAFVVSLCLLCLACVSGCSRWVWGTLSLFCLLFGVVNLQTDLRTERACREWMNLRAWGQLEYASSFQLKKCKQLYSLLNNRPEFLFEYGKGLLRAGYYKDALPVFWQAEQYSGDPMILNLQGKAWQALRCYTKAESCYSRAADRLPGRLYPYYLLACLYAEPDFRNREKFQKMKQIVLTYEPKVFSTAIREMRTELIRIEENWDKE